MHRQHELEELAQRLQQAASANLVAVVLYGSAADHEFHEKHSDLNVLCLVKDSAGTELAKLQPVGHQWARKGHPSPLVFTLAELRESADIFAIELLDMKRQHRMLLGEDFFGGFDVPLSLHRHQVERELRSNVVRLRQSFLASRGRREELIALMIASASTFATLFRHSLIALGVASPETRRDAAQAVGAKLGLDMAPFLAVLDLREGHRAAADAPAERLFAGYLDNVAGVAAEMDRRLAG